MKYSAYTWLRLCLLLAPLGLMGQVPTIVHGISLTDWESQYIEGLEVDAHDNVYLAGYFYGELRIGSDTVVSSQGGADMFIVSYDQAGIFRWVKTFGGKGTDRIMSMTIGPNGYLYVAGGFSDTVSFDGQERVSITQFGRVISDDACWLKLDTLGMVQDIHTLAGKSETEEFLAISIAKNGRIVAAGPIKSDSITDLQSQFLILRDPSQTQGIMYWHYDSNGDTQAFSTSYEGRASLPQHVLHIGMTAYSDGRVITSREIGGYCWMVTESGATVWSLEIPKTQFLHMSAFEDEGIFLGVELLDTLALQATTVLPGYALIKVNEEGTVEWTHRTPTRGRFAFNDLWVRKSSLLTYGFLFSGSISFSSGEVSMPLNARTDLFLTSHDLNTGDVQWARKIGIPEVEEHSDYVTVNHKGEILISGNYIDCNTWLDSVLFDNSYGCGFARGLFLAWSTPDEALSVEVADASITNHSILAYPNPTSSTFRLQGLAYPELYRFELYSASGQLLTQGAEVPLSFDLQAYPTGIYFLHIISEQTHSAYYLKLIKQP